MTSRPWTAIREQRAELARRDALTGLASRHHLQDRLAGELSRLGEDGGIAALHAVDLDGFRRINDAFGHRIGDGVLKEVAARLTGILRERDLAARIGGDGFVVLQAGCRHPGEAELMARRIARAVASPFRIEDREIGIAASVGAAVAAEDSASAADWLAAANAALARAKACGRNRIVVTEPGAVA